MYKRLYVPIDDSSTSKRALDEAVRFLKGSDAVLKVVHVIDLAQYGWGGAEFLDATELQKNIKEAGENVLKGAIEWLGEQGVTCETALLESWGDKIAEVLVEDADKWNADLIVMGTHGWGEFMNLIMGSVAEGVLRKSDVPVMLLRYRDEESR
ncbi:universal stress protein [Laribacter hongkongensis]|uniref:Universal stress protein n=1 Tax=Laribacter hongkongensis TaxID=168471 RepID=A0ABD4SLT7_9NEIS|nr:universal stress protein [Laribacter hongkongensis]MCG9024427.1 universal stress protein [Laribacter hongkongensis]MCG9099217.1 universal stress protein [Laribacter hongkongensis]MCG9103084.1 universal stress protein [Laribacter hongkongensis]MCG9111464.1 universal stress protein [Laribacter hongkongensis]MCG9117317.1 universal stress protein [Laribacter hongkongensis]